jgi:hypothetical protein
VRGVLRALLAVVAAVATAGPALGDQGLSLPPGEDEATWRAALAGTGLIPVESARAGIEPADGGWVLVVTDSAGRTHRVQVQPAQDDTQRQDIALLALSLMEPVGQDSWRVSRAQEAAAAPLAPLPSEDTGVGPADERPDVRRVEELATPAATAPFPPAALPGGDAAVGSAGQGSGAPMVEEKDPAPAAEEPDPALLAEEMDPAPAAEEPGPAPPAGDIALEPAEPEAPTAPIAEARLEPEIFDRPAPVPTTVASSRPSPAPWISLAGGFGWWQGWDSRLQGRLAAGAAPRASMRIGLSAQLSDALALGMQRRGVERGGGLVVAYRLAGPAWLSAGPELSQRRFFDANVEVDRSLVPSLCAGAQLSFAGPWGLELSPALQLRRDLRVLRLELGGEDGGVLPAWDLQPALHITWSARGDQNVAPRDT